MHGKSLSGEESARCVLDEVEDFQMTHLAKSTPCLFLSVT